MTRGLLIIIFLIGLFTRLLSLGHYPPGLNWDEASLGYNAYSLSLSGKDEWGVAFPAILRAFGDYKLPVYAYSAVPTIMLLGPGDSAVRLPSAVAGSLTILVSFVLGTRLFGRRAGLVTSLLVAIEPWTWFLSRLALEANLAILILTLGITLVISRRFVLASIFMGLSMWTYNSARIFVPSLMVVWGWLNRSQVGAYVRRHRFPSLLSLVLFITFLLPVSFQLLSPGGLSRFRWLTIIDSGAIAAIEHNRTISTLPWPLPRLLYNRPVYFATTVFTNYLSYFSPDFLFIEGGDHYQFSIQNHGLLYLIDFPLVVLGLVVILRSKFLNHKAVFLSWLLLAPIPGSLVRDAPHTLRAVTMLPLPMLLSAVGIAYLTLRIKLVWVVYGLILLASFSRYITMSADYPTHYSSAFQYGYRQTVNYIRANYDRYDQIIISKYYGEPHIFILYYWPWNPDFYRSDSKLIRYGQADWFWVDSFAKFRFVDDWSMPDVVSRLDPDKTYLIVASPQNPPPATDLMTINFLNGQPAFLLKQK